MNTQAQAHISAGAKDLPSTQIGGTDTIDGVLPAAINADGGSMNLSSGSIERRQIFFLRNVLAISSKRGQLHQNWNLEHAVIGSEQNALSALIKGAAMVGKDK